MSHNYRGQYETRVARLHTCCANSVAIALTDAASLWLSSARATRPVAGRPRKTPKYHTTGSIKV